MQKSFSFLLLAALSFSPAIIPQKESPVALLLSYEKTLPLPLPPDAGEVVAEATTTNTVLPVTPLVPAPVAAPTKVPEPAALGYPLRLLIPSIALNDKVEKVGVTQNGEMDVPAGSTRNVGWYKAGTIPGTVGSAVLDAHVFAAFANLDKVKVGDSVYVQTDAGKKLHFVVSEVKTYALADVPVDILFNRADGPRLNLITCAGKLTDDRSTYDHRLVIYTKLVNA